MPFGLRPEGIKGVLHVHIWRKNVPERGNSICKGPVVGAYPACSRKIRVECVSGRVARVIR